MRGEEKFFPMNLKLTLIHHFPYSVNYFHLNGHRKINRTVNDIVYYYIWYNCPSISSLLLHWIIRDYVCMKKLFLCYYYFCRFFFASIYLLFDWKRSTKISTESNVNIIIIKSFVYLIMQLELPSFVYSLGFNLPIAL